MENKTMTEELKHDHIKEIAENYVNESWGSYLDLDEVDLVMAGIGVGKIIASEQEKQIEIDAEHIRALQKQNGELTDKVKELESQNKKMKCCAKCVHCNTYITSCTPQKRFVRLEDVCEDFELRR